MFFILLIRKSFLLLFFLTSFLGCTNAPGEKAQVPEAVFEPGQVDIVTNTMDFQVRDTLTAGWNTFNYHNKSGEVHFVLLEKYPEGKGIKDAEAEVLPVFQQAMNLIVQGNQDAGFAEFAKLPKWFAKVAFLGGTGLIAPGKTARTTLHVPAGRYMIECYVKMPGGQFHSAMGMVKELVFIDGVNDNLPPQADVQVAISAAGGMVTTDSIRAGESCFAVSFEDQKPHENFVGHDVHLVRLKEGANISELEDWINWANPTGLTSPAPAAFEFLGGTQEMPAGSKAYFSATLIPGRYAFIAEVPEPEKKKMLYQFSIPQ